MKTLKNYIINERFISQGKLMNYKYDNFIEETFSAILEIIKNDKTISINSNFKQWLRKQLTDWMKLTTDDGPELTGIVLYCYSGGFYKKITSYLRSFLWGAKDLIVIENEYAATEYNAFTNSLKSYEYTYNDTIDIKYNHPYFRISLECGNLYFMKNCIL